VNLRAYENNPIFWFITRMNLRMRYHTSDWKKVDEDHEVLSSSSALPRLNNLNNFLEQKSQEMKSSYWNEDLSFKVPEKLNTLDLRQKYLGANSGFITKIKHYGTNRTSFKPKTRNNSLIKAANQEDRLKNLYYHLHKKTPYRDSKSELDTRYQDLQSKLKNLPQLNKFKTYLKSKNYRIPKSLLNK